MTDLTPEGAAALSAVAARHGVSQDAALHLLVAVSNGGGTMAQFSHPELGGMGQWSMGGMIMVGDMFNNALKARVDGLCNDLSALLRGPSPFVPRPAGGGAGGGDWWPEGLGLGRPASSGAQNAMRYAYFPDARRLAVDAGGVVMVYDTGAHAIGGFGQQQGGDASITLSSQFGTVRLSDLTVVWPAPAAPPGPASAPPAAPASAAPSPAAPSLAAPDAGGDVFAAIEKLGALRDRGVLTDAEFASKKAELLARI
jgi:hypothetical protein